MNIIPYSKSQRIFSLNKNWENLTGSTLSNPAGDFPHQLSWDASSRKLASQDLPDVGDDLFRHSRVTTKLSINHLKKQMTGEINPSTVPLQLRLISYVTEKGT
jgi:hypothetical protein